MVEKQSDRSDSGKIDVSYVANLARLELTADEVQRFQRQLEDIVGYVHKIGDLDLDGIEPTSHAWPVLNVFRADEVRPGLDHDAVMANAPKARDGQFVVPKIVE
jgi:aspartyl-tRNA(Asn)/glutamyl-tRNA(Gln) amidotransferase subunit C